MSVEQLCDYVARASFATTLGRRGYQQSEVDALLVKVAETLREGEPLADLVRRTQLTHGPAGGRLRPDAGRRLPRGRGRPGSERRAAEKPEIGRHGLVAKLFG